MVGQREERQCARRRTAGPQRMTCRLRTAPGGRREGPDVPEVEEWGVAVGRLQQRQQRAEEEDEHGQVRP